MSPWILNVQEIRAGSIGLVSNEVVEHECSTESLWEAMARNLFSYFLGKNSKPLQLRTLKKICLMTSHALLIWTDTDMSCMCNFSQIWSLINFWRPKLFFSWNMKELILWRLPHCNQRAEMKFIEDDGDVLTEWRVEMKILRIFTTPCKKCYGSNTPSELASLR